MPLDLDLFTAREPEARAILTAVHRQRSVLLVGPAGVGKSALLEYLEPVFQNSALTIQLDRFAPFGAFLHDLFTHLWDAKLIEAQTSDIDADRKAWNKTRPNNDTKARTLIEALEKQAQTYARPILIVDDAGGLTPSIIPWAIELEKATTMIVATTPEALQRGGTKRFWKLLEEVKISPLAQRESKALLDKLVSTWNVRSDDPQIYTQNVLARAAGNPGELVRLVKYHSSTDMVRAGDVLNLSQTFAERDERGIALAPILFACGAFFIAWRYIARARGDLDAYVLSGIAVGVFFVARLLFSKTFTPRSR